MVTELTSASSPRAKRDALRLLQSALSRAEWQPPATLPVVEQLCSDRDADVRVDALRLLAAMQHSPAPWLDARNDPAASVRIAAVQALALSDDRSESVALEAVLHGAEDSDPRVRLASLRALAAVRDPRALNALTLALRDPALDVRVGAASALGSREPLEPEALAALLTQVEDGLPEQRAAAVDALGRYAQAPAQDALEAALYDSDDDVVLAALRGVVRNAGRPLPARVSALALDPAGSPRVRAAATRLVQRRTDTEGAEVPPTAARAWLAPLEQTALHGLGVDQSAAVLAELERVLPQGASLAADPLVEWLGRAPPSLRIRIADLIERTGGPVSGAALEALLEEPDALRRAAYTRLLARAGARYEPALLARLQDRSEAVREAALYALSDSVQPATWSALTTRLTGAEGATRRDLLRVFALGSAHPAQWTALVKATKRDALTLSLLRDVASNDDVAASLALRVLGQLGTAAARAAVLEALRTLPGAHRGASIAALRASIADVSVRARSLRRALSEHRDPQIAASAVVALALAGDPLPWPWLFAQLGRAAWPVGPAASFALAHGAAQHSVGAAQHAWCPLLQQREPVTRHNVAWAIMKRESDPCRAEASELLAREPALDPRQMARGQQARGRGVKTPRAVMLQDARLIVSCPDGSGQIDWPRIDAVGDVNAWLGPYAQQ
ncbi:MAG: fumarate reductase/succinate dehydrogenase flavoprotein subunit [Myxococcaceae bacterium]|nr:fumarate reductase/succinate dehydrogenase flavoprotein subunit [Myxococcaceae bacterium]